MINTIYLHPLWGKLQQEKEQGKAEIFHFKSDSGEIIYPFIKRTAGLLNDVEYMDIVTARGENGPVIINLIEDTLIQEFNEAFQEYCRINNIIAEYIRFDPWNTEVEKFSQIYDVSNHGYVYCHNLQEDFFATQYSSKRRNQIRKAINSGVTLELEADWSKIDQFLELYQFTIDKHSVSSYYLIDKIFLNQYKNILGNRARLGFAYIKDVPIAGGIFLNGGDVFHYHFSASHPDFMQLNAISYLLMEEGKIGANEGCSIMDLGGATPGSGLEKFKRSMVKEKGILQCYVGTRIRNKEIYDSLVLQNGGPRKGYFPEYRR